MKKLLSILTTLMLLLTTLTPVLAEAPAAPLTLDAYLAGADAHAADYGYTLSWTQAPYADGMTMTLCDTFDGQPVLVSAPDGTLVAMLCGALYNPEHPETFNEDFVASFLFALAPILRAEGMDRDGVNSALADYCNADGFLPSVALAMETGEPMAFTFRGYEGEIALMEVRGQKLMSLFLVFDPAAFYGEPETVDTPAAQPEPPATVLTADYMAAMDTQVADYGGTLQWSEQAFPGGQTAHICDTLGGNPTLLSADDGTLVAISIASPIDETNMQATFDDFMGALGTACMSFCYMDGADKTAALEIVTPILNADGFIPGIIRVMTGGDDMTLTLMGYEATISRTDVDGVPVIYMLLVLEPELYYVQ